MHKPAILLTATIMPDGMSNTILQNSDIRKVQYLQAIEYYLKNTCYNIVVCENTNSNIYDEIKDEQKKWRLEYITFSGNNYDKSRGKGYGEAVIIKYALENSEFLKDAECIFKITGRVKIRNIKKLIKKRYIRCRNVIGIECWGNKWIHSVCFFCRKDWLYATVNNYGARLDDDTFNFQTMLYNAVLKTKGIDIVSIYPYIDGISGKTGKPYVNNHIYQRKLDHYSGLKGIYYERNEKLKFTLSYFGWLFYRLLVKMFLM